MSFFFVIKSVTGIRSFVPGFDLKSVIVVRIGVVLVLTSMVLLNQFGSSLICLRSAKENGVRIGCKK